MNEYDALEKASELLKPIPETVQFNHKYREGKTFAVDVHFTREDLLECVHNFNLPVTIKVGTAFLNPKDKFYNKRIGREVSGRALLPLQFKLRSVINEGDKTFLNFCNNEVGLELCFRVFKFSDKPHLINIIDWSDV